MTPSYRRGGTLAIVLALGSQWAVPQAFGADHLDSPAVMNEPTADLADVYAWMSSDASQLNLVLTAFPFAESAAAFSDATQYVFHITSRPDFGAADSVETRIICQFYAKDRIECWANEGEEQRYLEGNPGAEEGITSSDGAMRVFAGLRDDPFFFNLEGLTAVAETVRGATVTTDPAGCPLLDEETQQALLQQLTTDDGASDGGPATDDFQGAQVLALVISIDKAVVNAGGDILGVWASTHQAQ